MNQRKPLQSSRSTTGGRCWPRTSTGLPRRPRGDARHGGARPRQDHQHLLARVRHRPAEHRAYAASKGALKMMTRALAVERAPHNVQVNGIGPGFFKTEMNSPLVADASSRRGSHSAHPPDAGATRRDRRRGRVPRVACRGLRDGPHALRGRRILAGVLTPGSMNAPATAAATEPDLSPHASPRCSRWRTARCFMGSRSALSGTQSAKSCSIGISGCAAARGASGDSSATKARPSPSGSANRRVVPSRSVEIRRRSGARPRSRVPPRRGRATGSRAPCRRRAGRAARRGSRRRS